MERSTRVALGVLGAGLVLGLWADVLFQGQPLGLNVLVWTGAFTGALAVLLRVAHARWHQGRRWMLAPLLVFSAAFLWHESTLLMAVNLLALAGAVTIGALRRTGPRARCAEVSDYAAGAVAAGCAAAAGTVQLLQEDVDWDQAATGFRTERAKALGRGAAVGLPLLALFGGLFMAADAVFKSYITSAVPTFDAPLEHVLIIAGAAWLSAGLLRDLLAEHDDQRLVSPAAIGSGAFPLRLGTTDVAIALGALNALFLAFVLVQLRYLFGGQALVEARAHLTYAQYARQGYFELVVVSLLVLVVILAADALFEPKNRRGRIVLRCLSLGLLGLVFVVMASAFQRMRLYEQVYGLTELRVYALGVMAWLAAVFVWFAVTVLRGRRNLFAVGAVVAGFVATAALNVIDPDALIARTNLDRPRVDVSYVAGLSDDAVPALLAKLPTLRPDLRRGLATELLRRGAAADGWRSLNFSRSRAEALLAEHHDELVSFAD